MCYEYIDSWEILQEKSLPQKETFFSKLNKEGMCDRNCKHAQRIWNASNMKEKEHYVYFYNMQNVLTSLAVDIDFMKNMSTKFNFNHLNFVMLAWKCALEISEIEFELIIDVNMIFDYKII